VEEYISTAHGPTKWEKLAEFLKEAYPTMASEVSLAGRWLVCVCVCICGMCVCVHVRMHACDCVCMGMYMRVYGCVFLKRAHPTMASEVSGCGGGSAACGSLRFPSAAAALNVCPSSAFSFTAGCSLSPQ
jgi:hypothetical protein